MREMELLLLPTAGGGDRLGEEGGSGALCKTRRNTSTRRISLGARCGVDGWWWFRSRDAGWTIGLAQTLY